MNLLSLFNFIPKDQYLDSSTGKINLILSSPHGGSLKPFDIPKRRTGKVLKDTLSKELTEKIINLYGESKPYYVISNIHRSRVDLNRDIEEAAQGNYKAEKIWTDWNQLLTDYKWRVLTNHNRRGLYIDIHSKGEDDYFELGYNVSASSYLEIYRMDGEGYKSSVSSLKHSNHDMMFGPFSIKASLEDCGYKVLFPRGNEEYFNGGDNIRTFSGNGLGAIQIEVPVKVLKKDLNGIAVCLYNAIEKFRKQFV